MNPDDFNTKILADSYGFIADEDDHDDPLIEEVLEDKLGQDVIVTVTRIVDKLNYKPY